MKIFLKNSSKEDVSAGETQPTTEILPKQNATMPSKTKKETLVNSLKEGDVITAKFEVHTSVVSIKKDDVITDKSEVHTSVVTYQKSNATNSRAIEAYLAPEFLFDLTNEAIKLFLKNTEKSQKTDTRKKVNKAVSIFVEELLKTKNKANRKNKSLYKGDASTTQNIKRAKKRRITRELPPLKGKLPNLSIE